MVEINDTTGKLLETMNTFKRLCEIVEENYTKLIEEEEITTPPRRQVKRKATDILTPTTLIARKRARSSRVAANPRPPKPLEEVLGLDA